MSGKLLRGAADLLIGPRPTREVLKRSSQIPGFTPKSGREALYAGADRYVSPKTGKMTGVTSLGNEKYMNKAGDPLTAHSVKGIDTRKRTRGGQAQDVDGVTYKSNRAKNEAQQTEGVNDFNEEFVTQRDGVKFQAHHRAGLDQYEPFFFGLNAEERSAMRKHLTMIGLPTGNKRINRIDFADMPHLKAFHGIWEHQHQLKLRKDFFKDTPLKQRMEAAELYRDTIQQAYDEAVFAIQQGYNQGMGMEQLVELARSL